MRDVDSGYIEEWSLPKSKLNSTRIWPRQKLSRGPHDRNGRKGNGNEVDNSFKPRN